MPARPSEARLVLGALRFEEGAGRSGRATRVLLAFLLLAALLAYVNTLQARFLHWDDDYLVVENPALRSLDGAGLLRLLDPRESREHFGSQYLPLSDLSYALDLRLFGLRPAWFHAHGVLWHLVACALAFFLLSAWTQSPAVAFYGALWFALHPGGVEAVTWISGRRTVICTALALGACLLWLESAGRERRRARWALAGSVALAALAGLAKQSAVLLPVVLWALERSRARDSETRSGLWWRLAPHIALSAGLVALHGWVGAREGIVAAHPLGLWGNVESALTGWAYAARVLVWPAWLRPVYGTPPGPWAARALLVGGALVLLTGAIGTWLLRRRWPLGAAALLATGALLAPSLTGAGTQVFSERYLYPALPFAGAAVALSLRSLCYRAPRLVRRVVLPAVLGLGLLGFGLVTAARNRAWRDDLSLWRSAARITPDDPLVLSQLGLALKRAGEPAEATRVLERALALGRTRQARTLRSPRLEPTAALAGLYEEAGRFADAQRLFVGLVDEAPRNPVGYLALGGFLERRGHWEEAGVVYRALRATRPDLAISDAALRRWSATRPRRSTEPPKGGIRVQ